MSDRATKVAEKLAADSIVGDVLFTENYYTQKSSGIAGLSKIIRTAIAPLEEALDTAQQRLEILSGNLIALEHDRDMTIDIMVPIMKGHIDHALSAIRKEKEEKGG